MIAPPLPPSPPPLSPAQTRPLSGGDAVSAAGKWNICYCCALHCCRKELYSRKRLSHWRGILQNEMSCWFLVMAFGLSGIDVSGICTFLPEAVRSLMLTLFEPIRLIKNVADPGQGGLFLLLFSYLRRLLFIIIIIIIIIIILVETSFTESDVTTGMVR